MCLRSQVKFKISDVKLSAFFKGKPTDKEIKLKKDSELKALLAIVEGLLDKAIKDAAALCSPESKTSSSTAAAAASPCGDPLPLEKKSSGSLSPEEAAAAEKRTKQDEFVNKLMQVKTVLVQGYGGTKVQLKPNQVSRTSSLCVLLLRLRAFSDGCWLMGCERAGLQRRRCDHGAAGLQMVSSLRLVDLLLHSSANSLFDRGGEMTHAGIGQARQYAPVFW